MLPPWRVSFGTSALTHNFARDSNVHPELTPAPKSCFWPVRTISAKPAQASRRKYQNYHGTPGFHFQKMTRTALMGSLARMS